MVTLSRDVTAIESLYDAALTGNTDLIEGLLKNKEIDVNGHGLYEKTPLQMSLSAGRVVSAKLLLADDRTNLDFVNTIDAFSRAVLNAAVLDLQSERIDLNYEDAGERPLDKLGRTPLHVAVLNKDAKSAEILLKHSNINVNSISAVVNENVWKRNLLASGCAALHIATKNSDIDSVSLLLADQRTDINIRDEDGQTPLHIATRNGDIEIVRKLLADPKMTEDVLNAVDSRNQSALRYAVQEEKTEIVKLLVDDERVDVNKVFQGAGSVLHDAVFFGNVEITEILLDRDDININNPADVLGMTPLHMIFRGGPNIGDHKKVMEILLGNEKIDLNVADGDGNTPLHYSAKYPSIELAQVLLADERIDENYINKANEKGQTVLHMAAQVGYLDLVTCLLADQRTDRNIRDKDGKSAFDLAKDSVKNCFN